MMKHDIVIETPGWPHNKYSLRQFVGSDKSNVVYQCTKSHWQKCKFCCVWHEMIMMYISLYRVSLSENLVQASYRQKCKFTPEAVCCCLQTCNFGFDMRVIYTVPVDQVLPPDKITQASYKLLMPEAVCCCLQTCKCGFDITVVLCTSVPSLIVRNANTTKL